LFVCLFAFIVCLFVFITAQTLFWQHLFKQLSVPRTDIKKTLPLKANLMSLYREQERINRSPCDFETLIAKQYNALLKESTRPLPITEYQVLLQLHHSLSYQVLMELFVGFHCANCRRS